MDKAVEIVVKVVPGASRGELCGWLGDALKVRVAAPPEAGRANRELCTLLAERCGFSRSAVSVVRGATRPRKTVRIEGLDADAFEALFGRPR